MNNISIIKLNMNFMSVCLEQLQFIKNKILFKTLLPDSVRMTCLQRTQICHVFFFFLNQIVHTICIECTVKLTRIVELLASCRLVVYSQECYDWISSEVSRPKVNKRCSGNSRSYLFFPFTWWNQLWLDWTRYSHGPWPFHSSLPSHQNRFGFTSNVRYFIENTGVKKKEEIS